MEVLTTVPMTFTCVDHPACRYALSQPFTFPEESTVYALEHCQSCFNEVSEGWRERGTLHLVRLTPTEKSTPPPS